MLLNICGDYAAECLWWLCCWIFVVTMLLNTKSLRNKTGVHFCPKSIKNLLHQMFFWKVYVYNFWPSEIPWCVDKCITEGRWWY